MVVSATAAAESTGMATRHQSIDTLHTPTSSESRITNNLCESQINKRNIWTPSDSQVTRDIILRNHITTKTLKDATTVLGLPESNPRSPLLVNAMFVKYNRLQARSNNMRTTCIGHTTVESARTLRNRTPNSLIPIINTRLTCTGIFFT